MHNTCSNGGVAFFGIQALKLEGIVDLIFILALVIDVETIKTNACFFAIYWGICLHNSFYSCNKSTLSYSSLGQLFEAYYSFNLLRN